MTCFSNKTILKILILHSDFWLGKSYDPFKKYGYEKIESISICGNDGSQYEPNITDKIIDNSDLVFRLNDFALNPISTGSKTDFHYLGSTLFKYTNLNISKYYLATHAKCLIPRLKNKYNITLDDDRLLKYDLDFSEHMTKLFKKKFNV